MGIAMQRVQVFKEELTDIKEMEVEMEPCK
jgi:hypothetical protein